MDVDGRAGSGAVSKAARGCLITVATVLGLFLVLGGVLSHQVLHQGEGAASDSADLNALIRYDETINCFEAELADLRPEADHRGVKRAMKDCTDDSFFYTIDGQTEPRLLKHHNLSVVLLTEVDHGEVAFVVGTVGHGESQGTLNSTNEALTLVCWSIRVDVPGREIVAATDAECDAGGAERYQSVKRTTVPQLRRDRAQEATEIDAETSGTITALGLGDGGVIRNRDVVATIDGVTMVAYAAERPLGDDGENRGPYGASSTATLQRFLLDMGYEAGSVDGAWGAVTTEALTAFNRDMGLTEDLDTVSAATLVWIGPQRFAASEVRANVGDKVHKGKTLVSGSSAWWPY
jgi:hypothetical protein